MLISTITYGLAAILPLALAGAAPEVTDQPAGTRYIATLPMDKSTTGTIVIEAGPGGNGATIQVSINGLPSEGRPFLYHVHEKAVDSTGNCSTAGGHLDPYDNGGTGCNTTDQASCEVGNLSGKHGKMTGPAFTASYVDEYVSITPGEQASVVERSIVVHFGNKTAITCANITLNGASTGGNGGTSAPGYGSSSSGGQGSGSGSGSSGNGAGNGGAGSPGSGSNAGSGGSPPGSNGGATGSGGALGSSNAGSNDGGTGSNPPGSGNGGSGGQGGPGATTTQTVVQTVLSTMPAGNVKTDITTVTVTSLVAGAPPTSTAGGWNVHSSPNPFPWLVNTITEIVTIKGTLSPTTTHQTATQVVSNASTIVIIGTQAATTPTTSSTWTTLTSTKTDWVSASPSNVTKLYGPVLTVTAPCTEINGCTTHTSSYASTMTVTGNATNSTVGCSTVTLGAAATTLNPEVLTTVGFSTVTLSRPTTLSRSVLTLVPTISTVAYSTVIIGKTTTLSPSVVTLSNPATSTFG